MNNDNQINKKNLIKINKLIIIDYYNHQLHFWGNKGQRIFLFKNEIIQFFPFFDNKSNFQYIEYKINKKEIKNNRKNLKFIINKYIKNILEIIEGVSGGYIKKLTLQGVGYKVKKLMNNKLEFELGYNKPIYYELPKNIFLICENTTNFKLFSNEKIYLNNEIIKILKLRKNNIYNGTGFIVEEKIQKLKIKKKN